jgi:hypothetical protein
MGREPKGRGREGGGKEKGGERKANRMVNRGSIWFTFLQGRAIAGNEFDIRQLSDPFAKHSPSALESIDVLSSKS